MFTAPIVQLLILLFCNWCECSKPKVKLPDDVHSFNLTKRPLNLYITANGKHAVVQSKTIDLNNCDGKEECKVEKLTYSESTPPFLIKTRGSALIIYDLNSNLASKWHSYNRPSIVQMLAASGHRAIAVGLEHLWKQSTSVEKLVNSLNLTKIVLILPEIAYTDFDLLKIFEKSDKLDAVVAISSNKRPPILTKTIVINEKKDEDELNEPNVQEIVIKSALKEGNQEKVMQVIANFLDFVHPR